MASSGNLIASSSSSSSSSLSSEFESLTLHTNVQWLFLPDDVTEKILELLPITSYVRFASVCRQWRTIQQNHRLRHSPSPPPMLNLPFFIPYDDEQQTPSTELSISSPFDNYHYHFILDFFQYREEPSPSRFSSCSFPSGWLLLNDYHRHRNRDDYRFTLVNPISGYWFRLPKTYGSYLSYKAALSPPDSDSFSLFVVAHQFWGCDALFFRWGDAHWTDLSPSDIKCSAFDKVTNIVFCRGMFYFVLYEARFILPPLEPDRLGVCLYVVDPDPVPKSKPEARFIEMDRSHIPTLRDDDVEAMLVESNGELLFVVMIAAEDDKKLEVRVFKADLLKRIWVRVESISDRVLVLSRQFCASLVAADLGITGNCIYIHSCSDRSSWTSRSDSWTVFDVGSERVTDGSDALPSPSTHLMFLPSLCWSDKYS